MKAEMPRPESSKPARAGQARPARRRRSLAGRVGGSAALFYLAQGLTVAVILCGMALILAGMGLSVQQFAGDLSALASEEGIEPVSLAGIGGFAPPALPAPEEPTSTPAAVGAPTVVGEGFIPLEVAADRADEHAPPLPEAADDAASDSGDAAPAQPVYNLHLPAVQSGGAEDQSAAPEPTEPPPPPPPPPPGPPEEIIIPRIDLAAPVVTAPVYTVDVRGQVFEQWLAPDFFAAGWQPATAPAGAPGNTVITGHHNIYGEVFRRLHELEQGDAVSLRSGENVYDYVVAQVMILPERGVSIEQRQENARWILPSDDARLTLVTCWSQESNTHRLVVVAVPNR